MQTNQLTPSSAALETPINEAIQKSDSAQFALMLSLLFEAKAAQSSENIPEPDANVDHSSPVKRPSYNMNYALNQSLLGGSQAHFNMINSLYSERSLQPSALYQETSQPILEKRPLPETITEDPDNVLSDLHYAQKSLAA